MITQQQNEMLTRVGPETSMGSLLRRYWLPACLSEELPVNDSDPIRVRLLGEDLVAFRDSAGEVGLVDAYCPHRRAPLFYGRNEECGLRCVYHGWKFNTQGTCVDMPTESRDGLRSRVSVLAYPTFEAGGVVWTYMGPEASRPPEPDYEWLRAPETHRRVSKTGIGCNFLQALEGGIDTAHASFAHNNDLKNPTVITKDGRPTLEVERTPYGFRYAGIRSLERGRTYARVNLLLLPFQQMRAKTIGPDGTPDEHPSIAGHLWAPIDDESTYVYNFLYSDPKTGPIEESYWTAHEARFGRAPADFKPGTHWLRAGPENDFMIDRDAQRQRSFTGITGVNTQDFALQSGMGPIVDRTKEHLGTTDRAIIVARRMYLDLMESLMSGAEPAGLDPEVHRDVRAAEAVLEDERDWRDAMEADLCASW